jgi:plastocyanin
MRTRLFFKRAGKYVVGGIIALSCGIGSLIKLSEAKASPYMVVQEDTGKLAAVEMAQVDQADTDRATMPVISQKNRTFQPASVTIRAHHSISITNDDDTTHHAYCSAADFKFNSGAQKVGESVSVYFPTPGTYEVRCAIHPQMILVVTVTPADK